MAKRHSVYESITNVLVGAVISQVVLSCFGLPLADNLEITATMLVASFIRGYIVRRIFVRIHEH